MWLREALNQHAKISEIDQIFGINNCVILVNTVVYTQCKTGGLLSILQVKKCSFSKRKSEGYWSLVANETDVFFMKWERIANDL